ncbi:hypothetical protein CRG98_023617 [Punica granatum]|uniref:RCC1-like domain-containing protein n=1 Tax=Punica granatum TaxID=22663 RepID=A0A2I0JI97_PUNGR|nr:hypothetical protein CRG98_023617 [Punica granatum]
MEVNEDVPEAHQEGDEEEEQQQQVWSWGAGTDGQLGTGRLQDELLPQPLSLPAVSLLSCGGAHVVALSSGGRVLTWGRGSSGQLGHGEVVNHCLKPKPVTFPVSFPITHVSAGWSHSGFVSDTGRLFTCGDGSFGQLGHGDFSSHCCPVEVLYFASKNVGQVACGMRHSLVLLKGEIHSQVYGFGSCKRGQIGSHDVRMKSVNIPQVIDGFKNIDIVSISANGDHSAALSDAGEVSMLGGRHHGILSDPEKIGKNSFPEDGLTKTWGWGEHGQLGLGDTRDQILPQNVFLDQGQSNGGARCRVYCGSGFTYAIRTRNLFP